MYIINLSNPYATMIALMVTLLCIILGKEFKKSVLPAIVLGIFLGLGIALYFIVRREEKIERQIVNDQKIYSTTKLDETMKAVVEKINKEKGRFQRELTENEKDEIIVQCYKDKYSKAEK